MVSREQALGLLCVVLVVCLVVVLVAGDGGAAIEDRLDKLERRIERGERVVPLLKATAEAVATACGLCPQTKACAGVPPGWEPPDASSQEWDRSVAPPRRGD
jgi:hypothetical protein